MIFDTNILIAYLDGQEQVVEAIQTWKSRSPLFVSAVTTLEILALSRLTIDEIGRIKAFLTNFISVPFDDTLAETAALFKRTYHLDLPDAAIAATATMKRLPLVTRDQQFKKIKELTVIEV